MSFVSSDEFGPSDITVGKVLVRNSVKVVPSVALGILLISSFGFGANAQSTPDLSAREILDRMAMTYAHCRSYQDSGVVRIEYFETEGRRVEERPFKTAFVRPDNFRFEYTDTNFFGEKRRYIVWRSGPRVQTWWDIEPGIEIKESLGSALSGATGVSGSSAHTIPALLLPGEVEGRRLTDMTEVKRIADARCGDVDCLRVEGHFANLPTTVWVDQKVFLVRQIDTEMNFPTFHSQHTTTYEPKIDGEVAQGFLDFNPPEKK